MTSSQHLFNSTSTPLGSKSTGTSCFGSSSQYLFNSTATPLGSNSTGTSCFGSSSQYLFNSTATSLGIGSQSTRRVGFGARGPKLNSLGLSFRSLSLAAATRSDNNSDAFGRSPCATATATVTPFTPIPLTLIQLSPSSINSFSPSASDVNQHSINDDFTGERDPNLAFRHGGFGFDHNEDGGGGTATRTRGTNDAVAVSSSLNHYHHDLERAKQAKNFESFFWTLEIIREMSTQLNIWLGRCASGKYLVVMSWKDIVGDKRKKTTNGSKKIAAIDLLASTDTATSLRLTDDQMATMVKKIQDKIKYYRCRNKTNKLSGWQRLLLSDLERTHGIQIL